KPQPSFCSTYAEGTVTFFRSVSKADDWPSRMMGSTRCPACGQAIGTGSSFCPACGAQLSSMQAYGSPGTLSRMVPLFSGNGYTIEQKILALRDTFGIKDRGGNQLAYVKKQLVSFGPKFWYESTNGEKLGEIHGKVL